MDENQYYVVKQRALPQVLLNVVKAKKLLESEQVETIHDATEAVGISRSSFYKYKDDIFPFHDNVRGKTITFMLQMEDEPGALLTVLQKVAEYYTNILTIHQTIPINGIHNLSLTLDITDLEISIQALLKLMEAMPMVDKAEVVAVE